MVVHNTFISALFLIGLITYLGIAKVSHGTFHAPNTQWAFLDKFCFDRQGGELLISMKPSVNQTGLKILFYHDLDHGFPSVYSSENSCDFKVARSSRWIYASDPKIQSLEGRKYPVHGSRPRWWYVAVANCEEKDIQEISIDNYTIHFTNTGGHKYNHEFSKNEEGIFETSIAMLILLIIEAFVLSIGICLSINHTKLPTVGYAALLVAIGFECVAIICQLVHRDSYSKNGIGYPNLEKFYDFFNFFSEMVVLTLFIFIAKGWLMPGSMGFSFKIKDRSNCRTTLEILALFCIVYTALIIWGEREMDPAVQQEIYQSPPGVILVILRVLTMLWFCSCVIRTQRKSKNTFFYECFFFFGIVWFLNVPFIAIMAEILDDWNRKKVVIILSSMIDIIMYSMFFVLFTIDSSWENSKSLVSTDEFDSGEQMQHN